MEEKKKDKIHYFQGVCQKEGAYSCCKCKKKIELNQKIIVNLNKDGEEYCDDCFEGKVSN